MAAVVVFDEFGGPDVLRIVDEPVSEPGPGELRVRIEAFGVNRLDQMMRVGSRPRRSGSRMRASVLRAPVPSTRSVQASTGSPSATRSSSPRCPTPTCVARTPVHDRPGRPGDRAPTASTRSAPPLCGCRTPPLMVRSSRKPGCAPVTKY